MAIRYRFKFEPQFTKIICDGHQMSVGEVKQMIKTQRKIGKSEEIDLLLTSVDTNQQFTEESQLIPKHTSLIVMRIPGQPKSKNFTNLHHKIKDVTNLNRKIKIVKNSDLTQMSGSEEDKILAMMMQSTIDYQSMLPQQLQEKNFTSQPPPNYVCRRCRIPGHWIQKCSLPPPPRHTRFDPKTRFTGIPMSMRRKQDGGSEMIEQKVA